jgi:hypothetical protein
MHHQKLRQHTYRRYTNLSAKQEHGNNGTKAAHYHQVAWFFFHL